MGRAFLAFVYYPNYSFALIKPLLIGVLPKFSERAES